jgi:hypothetical protein
MNNKKEIYQNILKFSKEIKLLIQLGNYEKVDIILDKRAPFIEQINKEDFELGEIKVLVDEINAIDAENLEQLSKVKTEVYGQLKNVSRNKNVLALYKMQESYTGVVDETN